jgi:hypothetical protein
VFKSPAPAGPYGGTLLPLAATPNGKWSLYVQDFSRKDSGKISGGWGLTFVTSTSTTNCCSTFPAPTITSTTYSNAVVRFAWNAIPGPTYQVQYRSNVTYGVWWNLGAAVPATNTTMTITDESASAPSRFYRVMVLP